MSSLYELSAGFAELLSQVEQNANNADVEANDIIEEALSIAGMAMDDKVDNIIKYIKNLNAEAVALKNEAAALVARQKSKEKRVESLKGYLLSAGVVKYESTFGKITSTTKPVVEISKFDAIPKDFLSETTKYTPDKLAIKAYIQAGNKVDYAYLRDNTTLGVK